MLTEFKPTYKIVIYFYSEIYYYDKLIFQGHNHRLIKDTIMTSPTEHTLSQDMGT